MGAGAGVVLRPLGFFSVKLDQAGVSRGAHTSHDDDEQEHAVGGGDTCYVNKMRRLVWTHSWHTGRRGLAVHIYTITTDRARNTIHLINLELSVQKPILTTAYHPHSNGMVERYLKEALRTRGSSSARLEHLPWVLVGLRAAPKEDSGVSAAELLHGVPLVLKGPASEKTRSANHRIQSDSFTAQAAVLCGSSGWPVISSGESTFCLHLERSSRHPAG